MSIYQPAYLNLLKSGNLIKRVADAYYHLTICDVCALECPIDRRAGELGACKTGEHARVSSYGLHFGEEEPIRGHRGSGTIFFSRCNLRCQYCQNHEISQTDTGLKVEPEELAFIMLDLQEQGCHNINFVSPSHVVPQILAGVFIAAQAGLHIPLVYNTGGYDSIVMLQLLNGIVDIYMPDMKYADPKIGHQYSKVPNYPQVNQAAVKEMYRQVGDLQLDASGIAIRGLLVRHLVLPNNLAGTDQIVGFLSDQISTYSYLNLMDQYRPAYRSNNLPDINRRITQAEFQKAKQWAKEVGLTRYFS